MNEEIIERIQDCVAQGRMLITLHAQKEMVEDQVTKQELTSALMGSAEMIEDYPEDKRGHSHLILANGGRGPIHVCCALKVDELFIITVYRPDAARWSHDWRMRE